MLSLFARIGSLLLVTFPILALAQPPGFPGFGPPPNQETRKIAKEFDRNGDGWLNSEERTQAREKAKAGANSFRRPPGPPPGMERSEPASPGPKVKPSDVASYPEQAFYEPTVLRTVFLEFENADWEQELQDFHGTDVEVAATLTVDGKTIPNVGVRFRGMSSYMMVPTGSKRSLNITVDLADKKQRLYGYKNLNWLNLNEDPSFLSTVLYSQIAREHIPAPKANFVKVVINGESWGVYCNVQQFDKTFLEENYPVKNGTRWKVSGSPRAEGGLEHIGDQIDPYRQRFEIKSADKDEAWRKLIRLCEVLNKTPVDQLEAALKPMLDLDSVLWFLAYDVALLNSDGYWTRASDYSIFLDEKGMFHIVPHDMNEAFRPPMGPPPGGFAMLGKPGEILPSRIRDDLRLTPEQRAELDRLQKETDAAVAKVLTEPQRKQWQQLKEAGPPGMPGPPPGGGGFSLPFSIPGFGGGRPPGGPGGPMGEANVDLDPLVGLQDQTKPLRSRLLAVPSLKSRYLEHVREIAEKSLDWRTLGPKVQQWRKLIEKEVELDTKKLTSTNAFQNMTADTPPERSGRSMPLRTFADERRAYLLKVTKP